MSSSSRAATIVESRTAWTSSTTAWEACASASPIALLAEYSRDSERNRLPDGSIQSQQAHTLLLLDGLLALRNDNRAWFQHRSIHALDDSAQATIATIARAISQLPPADFGLLLLSGVFHDCGKLVGDITVVDADNAQALVRQLFCDALSVSELETLAFLVGFHDLVTAHSQPELLAVMAASAPKSSSAIPWRIGLAALQIAGKASRGRGRLANANVASMQLLLETEHSFVGDAPSPERPPPVSVLVDRSGAMAGVRLSPASQNRLGYEIHTEGIPFAWTVRLLSGAACRFTPDIDDIS